MNSENFTLSNEACKFGDWRFNPVDGNLCSKNNQTRLPPRLAKLLLIFVNNPQQVLSREILIENLWQEKSVNEDALSRCVAELRAILGDVANSPIYIETVPKKGYRFIKQLEVKKPLNLRLVYGTLGFTFLFLLTFLYLNQPTVDPLLIQNSLNTAQRVTADKSFEFQPEISNLGDKIVFATTEENLAIVKLIDLDGKLINTIKDEKNHLFSPTFAKDDTALFIAKYHPLDKTCKIFNYQLPTLKSQFIAECSMSSLAGIIDHSGIDNQLAYVAPGEDTENDAIWLFDLNKNTSTQITFPDDKANYYDTRPRFSNDGKQLSFIRGNDSVKNIYTLSLTDKTNIKQLTNENAFIMSFSWLKDDKNLIFDSNSLGERSLWLLNTNSSKKSILGARDSQYPTLNKANDKLVYQEVKYKANIWSVDLKDKPDNSNKTALIIDSIKYNNYPRFSPDGNNIAFASNRNGRAEIWNYSLETQKQTKILAIEGNELYMPNWSKDSLSLVISSKGKKHHSCYQVEFNTGHFFELTSFSQPHDSCFFGNSGEIFAISKDTSDANKLLKISPNKQVESLELGPIKRIEKSSLGTLIFTLNERSGFYTTDSTGHTSSLLIENFKPTNEYTWIVEGEYLYFVEKIKSDLWPVSGVWRLNLLTNKSEFITAQLPSAIGLTMSIKPDHSQLVLSRTDEAQADIYISHLKPN